jgi:hypothetical protein
LKGTGIYPLFPGTYPFQNTVHDDEVEGLVAKGRGEPSGLNKLDIANPFLLQTGASELDSFGDGLQRADLLYRVSQGVRDCAVPAPYIERAGATVQAEQGHPGSSLKIQNGGLHVVVVRKMAGDGFSPAEFPGVPQKDRGLLLPSFAPVILGYKEAWDAVPNRPGPAALRTDHA